MARDSIIDLPPYLYRSSTLEFIFCLGDWIKILEMHIGVAIHLSKR